MCNLQDIAGIVSTIYESIGKSVTVPHYGSKTIQVRLTVVPEDGNCRSHRERREARRRERREERRRECSTNVNASPPDCIDHSEDEQRGRLSPDDDASSKSSCSGDRRPAHSSPRQTTYAQSRAHRQPRREHRERKHTKKRSGSLQRRELLEIIQANMEKNHMSFQASRCVYFLPCLNLIQISFIVHIIIMIFTNNISLLFHFNYRKPCEPVTIEEEVTNKYQKLRNRSYTVSEKPINAFQKKKSDNSGNGYLDLASGGDSHLCRYDRYLHAVICSSARHANTGYHQKQNQMPRSGRAPHAHHARSRSHDLPPQAPAAQQPRVLQIIFL